MKLAARLDGAADAPVLVLSGALGTTMSSLWEQQRAELASHYRLLRHDLPGHGESPLPDGAVSVEAIGRALLGLLDELGVARAAFCGISLGGMVGMWLGVNAPDRITRLVLACTGAALGTPEAYAERAALVRSEGTGVTVAGARERWFTPAFRDSAPAQQIIEELRAVPAEGYAACCEAVGGFDFRHELGAIGPPTLVVNGEDDPMTPADVVDELVHGIPAARHLAIVHAAHLANVEQPAAFTAAVLSHLGERAST